MKKKLLIAAGVVVVLVVVAAIVAVANLNGIVRGAVETAGTSQLGQKTSLREAAIGLFSGNVSLQGLDIANAEGFDSPTLFSLGKLSVDTSYAKLFGKPVGVTAIEIDKPVLTLEFKGTQSNLKPLIDRFSGPAPEPAGDPLMLIVDRISVNGASVVIKSDLLGSTTIDIPAFEMKDIGNADGSRTGEEMGRVAQAMISELSARAMESGKMPPELGAILGADLDSLISNLGGQLQAKLQAELGDVTAKFKDQVGAIRGQLDGKTDELKEKLDESKDKLEERARGALGDLLRKPSAEPEEKKD